MSDVVDFERPDSFLEFFHRLFRADFMPHGHCFFWRADLVWLHVISDLLIVFAYYSIPIVLFIFVHKKKGIPFHWMFMLFASFIFWCGTTHLMNVFVLWNPVYRLDGVIKAITAGVSVTTALLLFPLIPKALALRTPEELEAANKKLETSEEEIRKLNVDLEKRVADRTADLENAVKELEAFSYSISHDLRAPLRAIGGFAEIVAKDYEKVVDEEGRRYLDIIRKNVGQMSELIDDLLAYSRMGRLTLELTRFDLNALAAEVLREFDELGVLSRQESSAVSVDPLPEVHGDRAMIRQVWVNLLSNAVKFTSKKPDRRIRIHYRRESDEDIFSFEDNGAGFDMAYVGKLFGVFQRLHSEADFDGTGVGLAIVQRVIRRHGGKAWAEGKVGIGAIFSFSLPRKAGTSGEMG